jgi:hypothetical protein
MPASGCPRPALFLRCLYFSGVSQALAESDVRRSWRRPLRPAALGADAVVENRLRDVFALKAAGSELRVGHLGKRLETMRHQARLFNSLKKGGDPMSQATQEGGSLVNQSGKGNGGHGGKFLVLVNFLELNIVWYTNEIIVSYRMAANCMLHGSIHRLFMLWA